jgi:hypothetical protein
MGLFFLVIFHLQYCAILKALGDPPGIGRNPIISHTPPGNKLVALDVLALVLGESVEKNSKVLPAVGNDYAISAGSSLSWPGYALLNQPPRPDQHRSGLARPARWPRAD